MNPQERLSIALMSALVFHTLIVLGVAFEFAPKPQVRRGEPGLDVILVSRPAPRESGPRPDFLAQIDQRGSGEALTPDVPAQPAMEAIPEMGVSHGGVGEATQVAIAEDVTILEGQVTAAPLPSHSPAGAQPSPGMEDVPTTPIEDLQRLADRIEASANAMTRRDRHKTLTANTREHRYAAYLDLWRRQVERIGNLNYPMEAKRRGLHGDVLVKVSIDAHGNILATEILRSSGQEVLDQGVLRILHLAAPFPPFPAEIARETDILDVIRTWRFAQGHRLQ